MTKESWGSSVDAGARADVTVRRLLAEEAETIHTLNKRARRRILQALLTGGSVYLAQSAGRVAHCKIIRTGRAHLRTCWLTLTLDPEEFYIEYAETTPEFRGQRITGLVTISSRHTLSCNR